MAMQTTFDRGQLVACIFPVNGIDPTHVFRVLKVEYEFGGNVQVLHIQDVDTGAFMDRAGYFAWRFQRVAAL